jgi:hypothetical protein
LPFSCKCPRSSYPSFGRTLIDGKNLFFRRGHLGERNNECPGSGGNYGTSSPSLVRRRLVILAGCGLVAGFAPPLSLAAAAVITLEVEATGTLPGLHSGALRRYLALHMTEARPGDWRFEPAVDDASAANRVVWTFKLNPFAGGSIRSHGPSPSTERRFGIHRPITIEARLYLNGEYQTLVEGQAIIQGGPDDPDLAATVASLTQSLLGPSGAYRSIEHGQR